MTMARRLVAEALGTAFLLAIVVGSGIMGERLAGGNTAIALLANSLATGTGLIALILTFGPISAAHFNPVVSFIAACNRQMRWRSLLPYCTAQLIGAFAGVAAAHLMFGEPTFTPSQHERSGGAQMWGEFVATFGLLSVICSCQQNSKEAIPLAIGAYIAAAYWFTASTSFANPAVTLARAATDTFSGIRFADTGGFIVAQFLGAASAALLFRWFNSSLPPTTERPVR
jgi:glycerol uptake facilitator-like aquaporin